MTKSKIILTGLIIIAAEAVLSLLVQSRIQARFRENDAVWRRQENKFAELTAENRRLSNLVVQTKANSAMAEDRTVELAKLRARVATLRQQTNQLETQLVENHRRAAAQLLLSENSHLLEHNRVIASAAGVQTGATGKLGEALMLARALRDYWADHEREYPLDLGQVAPYLAKARDPDENPWATAPLTRTNDFEIVYQGSQNDLTNIPLHRVALLRERQPWLTADGKWARVYGYADGTVNTVVSDDNFQSWDVQHVIPPQGAGQ